MGNFGKALVKSSRLIGRGLSNQEIQQRLLAYGVKVDGRTIQGQRVKRRNKYIRQLTKIT